MKKGEKLTYEQVCGRIREAVASIVDDDADTAKLHNSVARGKIELDESDSTASTFVCVTDDEEEQA